VARNRCKDHLLEKATELFSRNGFHATGIDTIIAEADVSRMSLYNNFDSKDDLIVSVLAQQDHRIEEWLKQIVEGEGSPAQRFDRLFDELGKRFNSGSFHGCPFTNAVAEYSCPEHPVHQAAVRHKERVAVLLYNLLTQMNVSDAEETAAQVMVVIDGGSVRAQILGDPEAHEVARKAACSIVRAAQIL
jgi:AcrR family transcriptional regulator